MSGHLVLVVAQAQDGSADLVVDALLARGADVARIDTADFPGSLSLTAMPERVDSPGWLCSRERRLDLASVTNVGAQAREFAAEVREGLIYKSLSPGVVAEEDEVRIIYTSRLTADDLDDGAIGLCCHLFQEWVPKEFDVRLTVVGDQFFAVAVHAGSPETTVDWRCRYDDLRYAVCETPEAVRRGVVAYLHALGLIFGAFDFSVTPDGRWWFLECNPAGQWGWIAEETGLPIAEAIAGELVRAV